MASTDLLLFERPHVLYMIEHTGLRLRKVGIGVSKRDKSCTRLDGWRQRGWSVVDIETFATREEARVAESRSLTYLDRCGARITQHMEVVFPNIGVTGRTEMYDPACCEDTFTVLLAATDNAATGGKTLLPPWIENPRAHAAAKAGQTRRAATAARKAARSAIRSEAARKAWVTRRARHTLDDEVVTPAAIVTALSESN